MDSLIWSQGNGSSKNDLHEAMCVVNKKGLIGSKTGTSKVPMMVKNKIIAIVLTMGPIELLEKQERQMDKELMVKSAKKATQKAPTYLQRISFSIKITNPSELSTIISPVPNKNRPIPTAMKPSQKTIKRVYKPPAKNLDNNN